MSVTHHVYKEHYKRYDCLINSGGALEHRKIFISRELASFAIECSQKEPSDHLVSHINPCITIGN